MSALKNDKEYYQTLSPLQKFVIDKRFDAFILAIIIINCVYLSAEGPNQDFTPPEFVLSIIFNIIYIAEVFVRVAAFGFLEYINDRVHYVDMIVSAVSAIDLILLIIHAIAVRFNLPVPDSGNTNVLRVISILRVLRALRPLKGLSFIPFVADYIQAVSVSMERVFLNTVFLAITVCGLAVLFFGIIGERLQYRCVPTEFGNPNVLNNEYFLEFGQNFFNSSYNSEVCGYRECDSGFSCEKVGSTFAAIQSDFSTPWNSFISILSFVTLRGWPNVFWAIHDAKGPYTALLALILIPGLTYLLVVNLFPAVFFVAMKREEERRQKRDLLHRYPGNLTLISELDLLTWGNASQREIIIQKRQEAKKLRQQQFAFLPWLEEVDSDGNSVAKKKALASTTSGKTITSNSVPLATAVPLGEEDETKPPEENEYDTTILVPNCLGCSFLRRIIAGDGSWYAVTILAVVVVNILILAIDSSDATPGVTATLFYSNIVFNSIYGLDVVLKIAVLGPVRYFISPLNILDFVLTLLGLLGVGGFTLQRFLNNFRILRLLRLLRLYRLIALADSDNVLKSVDISFTFQKLGFSIPDISLPIFSVITVLLLVTYMWSILGLNIFATYNFDDNSLSQITSFNSTAILLDGDSGTLLSNANLPYQWSGQNLARMNFGDFYTTYVTVFNVMVYNSWYDVMVNTTRITGVNAPWFFFLWIIIANYYLLSTLTSSILSYMELAARDTINNRARRTKALILEMKRLREKIIKRKYFLQLKRIAIDTNEYSIHNAGGNAQKSLQLAIQEASDVKFIDPYYIRFHNERKKHSFYVFSPSNPFRRLVKWVVSTKLYQCFIGLAILASVVAVVTDESEAIMSKDAWNYVNFITPLIFFGEMLLEWIANCVVGTNDAYFTSFTNLLDFSINIVLVLYLSGVYHKLDRVRIGRLFKMPQILLHLIPSESTSQLLRTYRDAYYSIFMITMTGLIITLFFGIVGLQIWLGEFSTCSSPAYPSNANRYAQSPTFPNGCSGSVYLPVYGLSISELVPLSWTTFTDNFDDIFKACKSVFKVMLFNNYANIIYNSFDITGQNRTPSINHSRAAFIFFMVVMVFALAVGVLFTSIVFYHFIIVRLTDGQGLLANENAVLWSLFQQKLKYLDKKQEELKAALSTGWRRFCKLIIENSTIYKVLVILYTLGPVVLVISSRDITYAEYYFFYVEIVLTFVYLAEYVIRQFVDDFVGTFRTLQGRTELVVVSFLLFEIAMVVAVVGGADIPFAKILTHIAIFARCFRLFISFNHMVVFLVTIFRLVNSFTPSLLILASLIVVYGKIGQISFRHRNLDYNNPFLNEHFQFKTILGSCITITAMATGNMWTEVIDLLKHDQNLGWKFYIETYFTTFYLLLFFFFRGFAILVISKYSVFAGGSLGIANQQLRQFRKAWLQLKNPPYLTVRTLIKFLKILPKPLGIGNSANFLATVRFTKEVLICMPEDEKLNAPLMFASGSLPDDVRSMIDDKAQFQFTFHMVLNAVHRRRMLGVPLSDENQFLEKQAVHKERVGLFKIHVARLTSGRSTDQASRRSDYPSTSARNQLILQRLNQSSFRSLFHQIMTKHLENVKKSISAYGFRGFDTFFISLLKKAAVNQHRASVLQLKLRKALNPRFLHNNVADEAYFESRAYELSVRRILDTANELSEKHVGKLWSVREMVQVAKFSESGTVSALAVDSFNTVYAGFSTGAIKIWRYAGGQGDVSSEVKFKLVQTIQMEGWVRSLSVNSEGLLLYVGIGSEAVLMITSSGRKRINFVESRRYKDHSGNVNAVVQYGPYFCTAADDGYVNYYSLSTGNIINSYYVGSSVYCLQRVNVIDSNDVNDDAYLTDVLACGSANGYLTVIPLPLLSGNSNETQSIEGISLYANNCAMSSVRSNWKFIYGGFVDGTVCVWAVLIKRELGSARYPIRMISIVKVSTVGIHSGPVTSIEATGGHLFTASHDFSISPWREPDKLNAKSEAEFSQSQDVAFVVHTHAIVCTASNKNLLVSGDDCGKIVVSAPRTSSDVIPKQHNDPDKVSFSFLEYDFKYCFLTTNGVTTEEECYLTITNISTENVTIRCLYQKESHSGFSVELNPITNSKRGAELKTFYSSGREVQVLQFGPNKSAQYRVVFVPDNEQSYSQLVEFLIDEKEVVKVLVRGVGVKNTLLVEGGRTIVDFESVTVNTTAVQTLRLVNPTTKLLPVSLYDEPYRNGDETLSLGSKSIQVIPRSFVVKENSSVDVIIRYDPEVSMPVFELPLKFICAGAVSTVATVRARAQTRVTDPDALAKKTHIPKEVNPVGLRTLAYSEALCPGELTNLLLNANGYRIMTDSHIATMLHSNTGLFLEFVNPETVDENWSFTQVVDTFRLTFRCQYDNPVEVAEKTESAVPTLKNMITTLSKAPPTIFDNFINAVDPNADIPRPVDQFLLEEQRNNFYEVWHGEHLLAYGPSESGKTVSIDIKFADLYVGTQDNRHEICGYQTLELLIFSNGERPRQSSTHKSPKAILPDFSSNGLKYGCLKSVTYVKVVQGYRVCRAAGSAQVFQTFPRVDVIGIERVVTFLPRGLGSVIEEFGVEEDPDDDLGEIGSPVFSPVKISLYSIDEATQYKIVDSVSCLEKVPHRIVKVQELTKFDTFRAPAGYEQINLRRPTTQGMVITEDNCSRRIDIELSRREVVSESGATEQRTIARCSINTRTVQMVHSRAKTMSIAPSLLFPHEIRSYPLSVAIEVVKPRGESLTRLVASNLMLNLLYFGGETRSKSLTNLFDGQWFFVVDRGRLKLLSADPDSEALSGLFQLSAFDVAFTSNGCSIILEDFSTVTVDGGQVIRTKTTETKPKLKYDVLRIQNFQGVAYEPTTPPSYLANLWISITKDVLLNELHQGLLGLLKKRQQRLRYDAEIAASALRRAQEEKERQILANRPVKQLTVEELHDRRLVENKAEAIVDALDNNQTYFEVFEEVVRVLNEYFAADITSEIEIKKKRARSKRISKVQFIKYLVSVPLPGFDKAYTHFMAELLLRDLLMDTDCFVIADFFKVWYESREGERLASQLNEKNVFAVLLDHELRREEGDSDVIGSSSREPRKYDKISDSLIQKLRLETGWRVRDERADRDKVSRLYASSFVFSYGSVSHKSIKSPKSMVDGVEFSFIGDKPAHVAAAHTAASKNALPPAMMQDLMTNMFGVGPSKVEPPKPYSQRASVEENAKSVTESKDEDNASSDYNESIEDDEQSARDDFSYVPEDEDIEEALRELQRTL